ncbi:hypothetical protein AVEN_65665-1 [Araneus ventricosus]|uniref:Uncharacterized protein n=1 Tax=Araneus ventricosus TaxID=182803 RepID=A0A4Y2HIJ6_ARAVE|nr:hypothetical protein AVEN_65665-1 [Araneus ventricosus]
MDVTRPQAVGCQPNKASVLRKLNLKTLPQSSLQSEFNPHGFTSKMQNHSKSASFQDIESDHWPITEWHCKFMLCAGQPEEGQDSAVPPAPRF